MGFNSGFKGLRKKPARGWFSVWEQGRGLASSHRKELHGTIRNVTRGVGLTLVNTVVNLRARQRRGNFLARLLSTVSFPGSALPRIVV